MEEADATLREQARRLTRSGDVEAAALAALRLLDGAPDALEHRVYAAELVSRTENPLPPEAEPRLHALVTDPAVNPAFISHAGWLLRNAAGRLDADDPEAAARRLEADDFALDLLRETYVTHAAAERTGTAARRWLLLSDRAGEFPRLADALIRQAAHNGGAWLFGEDERERLAGSPLLPAYLPPRASFPGPAFASPVTNAVAAQYDRWPFPSWTRTSAGLPRSLAEAVAKRDPSAPHAMPEDAALLIAGCGTGQEPVNWALRYPRARITAIDISAGAIAWAQARAAEAGVPDIRFELRDLNDVEQLGQSFDMIVSSGVLHHLPDPEAGWAALVRVLRPGGVMRIMVYSKLARLAVRAARAGLADLLALPVDDDLLRAARARLRAGPPSWITRSGDFFHLGGLHDLLFHAHEDPFDVPRIRRAVEALGLDFLGFQLPTPADRQRYRAANPDDPLFRDFAAWAALEKRDPTLFTGMYCFWCRKPGQSPPPISSCNRAYRRRRAGSKPPRSSRPAS